LLLLAALGIVSVIRSRKAHSNATLEYNGLPFISMLLFGLFWFLVFLVPSFIRPNAEYPADFIEHRIYVPMIGLLLIAPQVEFIKKLDFRKAPSWLITGLAVYVLSLINIQHLDVFSSRIAFWENASVNSPSHPLAHKNLGAMYYLDSRFDLAEKEYLKALDLYPQEKMAHNNLGLLYMMRGEYQKAQEEYKKELAINPTDENALFNWGRLCYKAGNKKDAETLWRKALEANPDDIEAMKLLYALYSESGDTANIAFFYHELAKRGAIR
jgi:protein O-mannosyl-transferase